VTVLRRSGPLIEAVGLHPEDWRRRRRLRLAALTEAPEAFAEHLTSWTGRGDTGTRWRDRLTALPLDVILTVDGDDAGMVSATSPDTAGQISLVSLWVMPWARGRGVGDVAVHAILAYADLFDDDLDDVADRRDALRAASRGRVCGPLAD
jgi:hypothetical protein